MTYWYFASCSSTVDATPARRLEMKAASSLSAPAAESRDWFCIRACRVSSDSRITICVSPINLTSYFRSCSRIAATYPREAPSIAVSSSANANIVSRSSGGTPSRDSPARNRSNSSRLVMIWSPPPVPEHRSSTILLSSIACRTL
ncbi:hypothetical protein [Streptomyces sp. NBC_00826]|uniref:hypothetical protein n=1 Tax=Streptomyces sp. NBC_00826 TaxID=2975845 RepID=UPI003870AD29|nr:hypothetical protein OG832_47950 [Streptomyces sp. NBC_00826]